MVSKEPPGSLPICTKLPLVARSAPVSDNGVSRVARRRVRRLRVGLGSSYAEPVGRQVLFDNRSTVFD